MMQSEKKGYRGKRICLRFGCRADSLAGGAWGEGHSPRVVQEGTACGGLQRRNSLALGMGRSAHASAPGRAKG